MTTITFPDGSWLIDDSEIEHWHMTLVRASKGADEDTIAREFRTTVEQVRAWMACGPLRDPQEYWMERWRNGTLHEDEDADEIDEIEHTGD